jgi:alpha-acetolactate decarboxylase
VNKRIKELAEQTGYIWHASGDPQIYEFTPEKLAKFAELIVFECTKAVMDGTKEGDHYAQRIEQHFDNGTGGVLHFGVEP